MENTEEKKEEETINKHKNKVHKILAISYSFYFIMFLVGIFFDYIFSFKIFKSPIMIPVGLIFILLATFLIYWAQKTSRNLKKDEITKETFKKGPYVFTSSPTHWGLFLLIFGFGLLINAFFVVITSVISFFITKIFFLRKEEAILKDKYGDPYAEYKKSIKL